MFLYTRRLSTFVLVVALILLALTTEDVHAKRNSKSSGSSRSTSSRKTTPRTTKAPPGSYLAPSHRSAPSNHAGPAHHSVPAHRSKSDNERLSYGGGKESKVFNPQTVPSVTTSPFGRNAPAQPQGPPPVSSPKEKKPPPFYTPPTHKNGRPNIHSPSRPAAGASPSSRGSHYGAAHSNTGHRGRNNSTGKYGSSGGYQPIKATNAHKVQSSYPREQLPPGATYHPAGQIPAGATYHPAGQIPAGATYHPPGQIPAGATFHPAAQIPAGASYQTAGQVPHGATFNPGSHPAGGSYYPQGPVAGGVPSGATFLPAGGALPAGAVFHPQAPQKSRSGLGLGTGLIAGAVGGATLGAITPNKTSMVDHLNSFFGSNGGNGREKGGDDEITIIDNGAVPPVFASPPASDFQEDLVAPVPEAVPSDPSALAPEPPVDPETPVEAEPVVDPDDLYPADPSYPVYSAPDASADPSAPPAGQSICVVVKVPQPDPKDPTKTIEVDKSACYQESTAETDPSAIGWD